jgi:hypothetical protein
MNDTLGKLLITVISLGLYIFGMYRARVKAIEKGRR